MKVFVTGMGVVSSLGNSVPEFIDGLLEGRSGVRVMEEWKKYNGLHSHLAAPVPEYDVSAIPRQVRRTMSRMSEMATVATLESLAQAGLAPGASINRPRTLILMGSTSGSPSTLEVYFKKLFERGGPEGQLSTSFFKVMNHSVPANVASALGFHGAMLSPSAACATSSQAMVLGWELIRAGLYDTVIAGGADELHYMSAAVFDIVHAASRHYNDRPNEASRPFDRARDGLVVSEGASVVVLEGGDRVAERGATPLAEMLGGAYLCDGTHMSQSSFSAMAEVMRAALERSKRAPSDVDYVNAHATATVHGDEEEAKAIGSVFGGDVPVSSLKGHLGHNLAACGVNEAIASVEMIRRGLLIPTRNLTEVAPECAMVRHVQRIEKSAVRTVLSNNFAFGGMNTSLVLSEISPKIRENTRKK